MVIDPFSRWQESVVVLNTEWPSLRCTVLTAFQKVVFVVIIVYLKRNYFLGISNLSPIYPKTKSIEI